MDSSKRILQGIFAGGTIVLVAVLWKFLALVFNVAGVRDPQLLGRDFTLSTLLAGVIGVATLAWAWRHARIRPLATETSEELTRVTWPSWQETKMNAWTTVVVSVLVAIILGVMDMVFGNLTNFILGGAA
jgi:preprotein translocase SecE subunit